MKESIEKIMIDLQNEQNSTNDEATKILQEYWANIADMSAGMLKERFKSEATDTMKRASPNVQAINETTKLFNDASLRASEFADKAARLEGQGNQKLQKLFEGMSSKLLEDAKNIKNDEYFNNR